jgi:hypothetical protein
MSVIQITFIKQSTSLASINVMFIIYAQGICLLFFSAFGISPLSLLSRHCLTWTQTPTNAHPTLWRSELLWVPPSPVSLFAKLGTPLRWVSPLDQRCLKFHSMANSLCLQIVIVPPRHSHHTDIIALVLSKEQEKNPGRRTRGLGCQARI